MIKQLFTLPKFKQHLYSLLISILGMSAAVACSSFYCLFFEETAVNMALIFILFLILISCNTTGYFYGILCSGFIILWFNYRFTYPFHFLDFTRKGYPLTFLFMSIITVLISLLSSRIALHYRFLLEKERVLAEAEMERMRANLLRAVSHDLRTPLTGIIGNSQAYLDNRELLTEDEKIDIITNIYEDSSWLVNMVENLLTITRIHSSLSIKTSEEPLEEVVGEALIRMQKRYPDCVIHAKIPEDFILLPMDAVLIEQVIINLLENALKHSGSDSPIDFIVENDSRNVTFIVRDYGNGISKAALSQLFSGTPISSPEADGQKGAGIGLVICKTIIDAHHGTILGRNHENGAEFLFTLPKKKEEHPCLKK